MPMSFAIAVLAVFGLAKMEVMNFSESDILSVYGLRKEVKIEVVALGAGLWSWLKSPGWTSIFCSLYKRVADGLDSYFESGSIH